MSSRSRSNIIRFPAKSAKEIDRVVPKIVIADALCRMNLLIAAYVQPGERHDAEFILMKIAEILCEPELCKAAGIMAPQVVDTEDF